MAKGNETITAAADRELVITRVFNAPRPLVFEAWTNPTHLLKWWGPRGFTNTFLETDIRPGGVWRFIMHGPNGMDFPNKIVFLEVVKPELLVYDHSDDTEDNSGQQFRVTVLFEDEGKKTKLTMRMLFQSAEELDKVVKEYGAIEGANQTMAKLEELLATLYAVV